MRSSFLLLVPLAFVACKKSRPDPPRAQVVDVADNGESSTAVTLGGGQPDRLAFTIQRTYEKQTPTNHEPWHEPVGEWMFAECTLAGGTHFGFGLVARPKVGDMPVVFGDAMLTVASPDDGATIVTAFAEAFHAKKLPRAVPRQPLDIRPFGAAILGEHQARRGSGYGGAGSWTTTKLFLQRGGTKGEVFFNFDLDAKTRRRASSRRRTPTTPTTSPRSSRSSFATGHARRGRQRPTLPSATSDRSSPTRRCSAGEEPTS